MKYGVFTAAALTLSAALDSPGAAAAPMPRSRSGSDLALRRVLLSSGGVGYFEYEATLQGEADLRLKVRRDQVDDVLKSIVVFDDAGNLGEVSLPGKDPATEGHHDPTIPPSALDSPAALLSALRGAEVRVESAGGVLTGRIVSVTEKQVKPAGGETVTRHRLTLLADGAMHQVMVEEITSLRLMDEALQSELDAALDSLAQYLARLDEQEARLSALDQEIADAEGAVKVARERLAAEIRSLHA